LKTAQPIKVCSQNDDLGGTKHGDKAIQMLILDYKGKGSESFPFFFKI